MKRAWGIIAALIIGIACQAAQARKASPEKTTRVLVKSGPAKHARNWAPEGRPRLGDTLIIPGGKRLEVTSRLEAGNLIEEPGGEITGPSPIQTTGSVDLAGRSTWTGTLNSTGVNYLSLHGNTISDIEQREGVIVLRESATIGRFNWHANVDTEGHELVTLGLAYPLEGSSSNYSTSVVRVGEWLDYVKKREPRATDTLQFSMGASFVVSGLPRSTFKGAGWCYGSVTLEAQEMMLSAGSYEVEDDWVDNTPVLTFERGQTIKVEEGNLVFGAAAQVVQSSEPGVGYTIEIPRDLEVTTEATISDMHVVDGTLTVRGGHDGGGNRGIQFVG